MGFTFIFRYRPQEINPFECKQAALFRQSLIQEVFKPYYKPQKYTYSASNKGKSTHRRISNQNNNLISHLDHIQVPIDLSLILSLMQNPLSSKQMRTDKFFTQQTGMDLNEIHLLVPLTYFLSKGKVVQCVRSHEFGPKKGTLRYLGQNIWDIKETRTSMQNKPMFTTVIETRAPFEKETRKVIVKQFKLGLRDGKAGRKHDSSSDDRGLENEARKTLSRNECRNFVEQTKSLNHKMSLEEFRTFIRGMDSEAIAEFENFYEKMRCSENPQWNEIFRVRVQPLPNEIKMDKIRKALQKSQLTGFDTGKMFKTGSAMPKSSILKTSSPKKHFELKMVEISEFEETYSDNDSSLSPNRKKVSLLNNFKDQSLAFSIFSTEKSPKKSEKTGRVQPAKIHNTRRVRKTERNNLKFDLPDSLGKEKIEFYMFRQYLNLIQEAGIDKKMQKYQFIQNVPLTFFKTYKPSKFHYDVSQIDEYDNQLFERAMHEAKSISRYFPESSPKFITQEQEKHFCHVLMNESPDVWKEYCCHKMYQACRLFADMELKRFVAEFADDGFGNIWLIDVKIFDIRFPNLDGFYEEKRKCENNWELYTKAYLRQMRLHALKLWRNKFKKFSKIKRHDGIKGEIIDVENKLEYLRKSVGQQLEMKFPSESSSRMSSQNLDEHYLDQSNVPSTMPKEQRKTKPRNTKKENSIAYSFRPLKIENKRAKDLEIDPEMLKKAPFYPLQMSKGAMKPMEMKKNYRELLDKEFLSIVNSYEDKKDSMKEQLDHTFRKLNPNEKQSIADYLFVGNKQWKRYLKGVKKRKAEEELKIKRNSKDLKNSRKHRHISLSRISKGSKTSKFSLIKQHSKDNLNTTSGDSFITMPSTIDQSEERSLYQQQIQKLGMRKDGYLIGAGVKSSAQVIKDINSVTMRSRARRMMKRRQAEKIKQKDATRGFESSKAGHQISKFIKRVGVKDGRASRLYFQTTKDKFLNRDMKKIMEKRNVSLGCNLKGSSSNMINSSKLSIGENNSASFSRTRYKGVNAPEDPYNRILSKTNLYSKISNRHRRTHTSFNSKSTNPYTSFTKTMYQQENRPNQSYQQAINKQNKIKASRDQSLDTLLNKIHLQQEPDLNPTAIEGSTLKDSTDQILQNLNDMHLQTEINISNLDPENSGWYKFRQQYSVKSRLKPRPVSANYIARRRQNLSYKLSRPNKFAPIIVEKDKDGHQKKIRITVLNKKLYKKQLKIYEGEGQQKKKSPEAGEYYLKGEDESISMRLSQSFYQSKQKEKGLAFQESTQLQRKLDNYMQGIM